MLITINRVINILMLAKKVILRNFGDTKSISQNTLCKMLIKT